MCKKTKTVKFKGRVIHKRVYTGWNIFWISPPMRRLPSANGLHRPRSCSRHPYNSQDEVPNEPGGGAAAPDQRVLGRGGLLHDGLFTPRYRWVLRNFIIIIMVFGLENLLACRYYFITFSPTSFSLDLIFFLLYSMQTVQRFLFTFLLTNLVKFWDRCAKISFEYLVLKKLLLSTVEI